MLYGQAHSLSNIEPQCLHTKKDYTKPAKEHYITRYEFLQLERRNPSAVRNRRSSSQVQTTCRRAAEQVKLLYPSDKQVWKTAASFGGATVQGLDNSIINLYDMGVFLAIIKDYFLLERQR